jgi:iron complex outermembrane receptor protein
MPRAPSWQINLGGDYTRELARGHLTLSFNSSFTTSYVVRDASLWGPLAGPALANKQRFRTGDFAILNTQLNWTDPTDHYTVGVYCDNCTNTRYRITFGGSAFGDYQQFSDPAGAGVRVGYKF